MTKQEKVLGWVVAALLGVLVVGRIVSTYWDWTYGPKSRW